MAFNPGKFLREVRTESAKIVWPTRKETVQMTLIVFAFVVVTALFLFAVDSTLAWLVQLITGRTE